MYTVCIHVIASLLHCVLQGEIQSKTQQVKQYKKQVDQFRGELDRCRAEMEAYKQQAEHHKQRASHSLWVKGRHTTTSADNLYLHVHALILLVLFIYDPD